MSLSGYAWSYEGYEGRNYGFYWTATQSVANNTSTISWRLTAGGGNAGWYAERDLRLTIDGRTVFSKTARVERYEGTVATGTITLAHDSSGRRSFDVSIEACVYYASGINSSCYPTFTLDTIPRESSFSVSNGTLGTAQTISVYRASSGFTHTITATCGGETVTVCSKSSSSSISFTPPLSWANYNTTGTSVSVTYRLTTYSGSSSVGSSSYTRTCTIPSSIKPSCAITVTDATTYLSKYGSYIKGKSKLKVTISATTSYGSAIASYSTTANGSTYTTSSFTTGVLSSSGTLTIKATVTDKRGRTGTTSVNISVLNYIPSNVTKLTVRRCNSDGTANEQGEYVQVTFSGSVDAMSNQNTVKYVLQYKKTDVTTWTTVNLSQYNNVYSVSNATYIFAAESGSSYDVRLQITDNLGTTTATTSASTAFTLMHFSSGGTGMGIGKIAEIEGVLDIGNLVRFYGGILQPIIGDGSDLDDIKTPNVYTGNAVTTAKYLNCPISTGTSFTLEVMSAGSSGQLMQRFTSCTKTTPLVYIRHYYASAWGAWVQIN